MNRRTFVALAAAGLQARPVEHGMQLHLSCGALGIKADQQQALDLAARHGFDGVDADGKYLGGLSDGELTNLAGSMKARKISFALAGLPVDFRRDEATFSTGMAAFPAFARGLQRAGV